MKDLKAVIIHPDDSHEPFDFKGKAPSLEEMQEAVGGLIEVCPAANGNKILVLSKEGMINSLPFNPNAARLSRYKASLFGSAIYMDSELF